MIRDWLAWLRPPEQLEFDFEKIQEEACKAPKRDEVSPRRDNLEELKDDGKTFLG